jgi:uncharacterized integral membrane protein
VLLLLLLLLLLLHHDPRVTFVLLSPGRHHHRRALLDKRYYCVLFHGGRGHARCFHNHITFLRRHGVCVLTVPLLSLFIRLPCSSTPTALGSRRRLVLMALLLLLLLLLLAVVVVGLFRLACGAFFVEVLVELHESAAPHTVVRRLRGGHGLPK